MTDLSPEDQEAQRKGLALVTRIEHLLQTDEAFRRWLTIGSQQIERGEYVTFDENGWKDVEGWSDVR